MHRHRTLAFALLPSLIAVSALAQAGSSGELPVFRSESRQVIVDAIAMDGKGNYVRNLSPQDFRLWEDGKEQAIQSVIRVSTPGSSPAKQKQYIVLYFERMSFEDQIQLRDAAIRFAETSAGPDRVMAVLQHDGYGLTRLVQEFTDDAAELRRAIGKARASAIPTERNGETRVISLSQNRARMYDLMRLLKSLSTIPGRKALVLFSPDRSPSPQSVEESSVRELIDSANKANTAVYPISSMGWMDRVAKETGGLMTISAYASEALQKVASEQNEYYLISYVPAKSAENSCHAIRLAVSRPGVRLRARSQYCNLRPADPLAGTELDRQMVAAAASSTAGATKTPAQVTFFYTKAGTARVHVAAEVPPAVVKFDKQEGKVRSRVNVLGIAYRKDGSVGARFSEELDYVFDQRDKAEAFLKQPIGYQAQMEVVPGEYLIKLVFGSDRGAPATLQASLGIEAYDSKGVAISGLALCKEVRDASGASQDVDAILAANRTPLVSKGMEFVPATNNVLRRADNASIYFEVYDPALEQSSPPAVHVELRIINAATGQIAMNSGVIDATSWTHQDHSTVPMALRLRVESLSPGAYRLEARAKDAVGNSSGWRSREFSLID